MRAGRRLKAERGGYAGDQPPYGYRAENRELVAILEEQEAIALANELRRQGITLGLIATTLENLGFHRRNGSTRWHRVQVARALKSQSPGKLAEAIQACTLGERLMVPCPDCGEAMMRYLCWSPVR